MAFTLPNPTVPTNGQPGDATPILANEIALAQAIASFDGSQIQNGSIVEAALANAINPRLRGQETLANFIFSGCIWTLVSGFIGTMTGGTIYVNGYRTIVTGIGANTFNASNDTYVDIDYLGNVTYLPVSNGGTAPGLTANALRVAKVVTNGSTITSVVQTGIDSNNIQIYPTKPDGYNNWVSWIPVVTLAGGSAANGNAVVTGGYIQIGKTICFWLKYVVGSTTTFSGLTSITASLPVTASSNWANSNSACAFNGFGNPASQNNILTSFSHTTTTFRVVALKVDGTYALLSDLTSSVPGTWATGNLFNINGVYETA